MNYTFDNERPIYLQIVDIITNEIISIKNPTSGSIIVKGVKEIIIDDVTSTCKIKIAK